MSDNVDILRAAVYAPEVLAAVDEATVLERIEQPAIDSPDFNPLVSNVRIVRPAEPADYVAAIHEHIDNFDGLHPDAVTEAAVAAVLPQQEEEN